MGRSNKQQGFKNLAKVVAELDTPRFQKVFFTRGSTRLPFLISDDRLDGVATRFQQQGWQMERDSIDNGGQR